MICRIVVSLCFVAAGAAQAAAYRVEMVAEGLDHPWSVAFLPDEVALVTERVGRLRVIERGVLRATPVAGVPAVHAASQGGLLEVLAAPDFATSRRVYLSYAFGTSDANGLRVAHARFDGTRLHEVTPILTAQPLKQGDVHYGGRMAWLGDGTLAIGLGDGFIYRESAQKMDTHLGKILRIAADGSVPPDNPFVGHDHALAEIYSLGHRNVQGLVFDAASGRLYAHEHGPRGGDELNRIEAGANYGWPIATLGLDYTGARVSPFESYEGTHAPLRHWTPSIAPSGLALYRGALFPQWRGSFFVTALAERSLRRIPADGGDEELLLTELGARLRDVREAPDGSLWVLTDEEAGRVLRLVPEGVPEADAQEPRRSGADGEAAVQMLRRGGTERSDLDGRAD